MRHKEKSIRERKILDGIINRSRICHVSCCQENIPYLIPISFGYDGSSIYFHTARAGKKVDIWESNPNVCLVFETDIDLVTDPDKACEWTYHFQSVIAEGMIREVKDQERKNIALNHIMRHYSGKDWDMPEREMNKTKIWVVDITTLTGKRSPAV